MTVASSGFLEELEGYDAIARRAALRYLCADGVSQYLGAPAAEYLERGGKGLRPALCLATCKAFGGEVEDALPSAAAIELCTPPFSSTTTLRTTANCGEVNLPCTESGVGRWPSMLVTVWPFSRSGHCETTRAGSVAV
jgi:geranylgeranyl diphosphate synthase type II